MPDLAIRLRGVVKRYGEINGRSRSPGRAARRLRSGTLDSESLLGRVVLQVAQARA